MAKQYIPPHILPYDCDLDIPPFKRQTKSSHLESSRAFDCCNDRRKWKWHWFSRLGHKRWCGFHLLTGLLALEALSCHVRSLTTLWAHHVVRLPADSNWLSRPGFTHVREWTFRWSQFLAIEAPRLLISPTEVLDIKEWRQVIPAGP